MTSNGKTIHDHQSFVNIYSNFKMLSSMSPSDVKSNNTNFGMASELDNHRSMEFLTDAIDAATTGVSGFGITNNHPFETATSLLQKLHKITEKEILHEILHFYKELIAQLIPLQIVHSTIYLVMDVF
jgi:hypothetical protein